MNLPLRRDSWPAEWRELFEERAGIIEFQGNVTRHLAEKQAEADIRLIASLQK